MIWGQLWDKKQAKLGLIRKLPRANRERAIANLQKTLEEYSLISTTGLNLESTVQWVYVPWTEASFLEVFASKGFKPWILMRDKKRDKKLKALPSKQYVLYSIKFTVPKTPKRHPHHAPTHNLYPPTIENIA